MLYNGKVNCCMLAMVLQVRFIHVELWIDVGRSLLLAQHVRRTLCCND